MLRQSYSDMLKDDDERMKIISPTYRELGKKKYDEMMEQKGKEIGLQKSKVLKEILNDNSKNKSDSDTLIIYNYNLTCIGYFQDIISSLIRSLYNKYGNVHFISFGGKFIKDKRKHYKVPHDIIQLDDTILKLDWCFDFFENINDEYLDQKYIDEFHSKFRNVYNNIYTYTLKKNDDLEYIISHIEDIRNNTLDFFRFYDNGIDVYCRYEDNEKNDFN